MRKLQHFWLTIKIHTTWRMELLLALMKNRMMQKISHDKSND